MQISSKCDLKIALYWSRIKSWSLVSANSFDFDGISYSLSMEQCMKRNEMHTIGDSMVGTVPPLTIRFLTDPERPRSVKADGSTECTIGSVELWCGSRQIENPIEKKLAWFFVQFGDWSDNDTEVHIKDGQLIWFEISVSSKPTQGQHFSLIGFLSQMVSRQYDELTTSAGEVEQLTPSAEPEALGIVIPPDYSGRDLKLWRFIMSPNYRQ